MRWLKSATEKAWVANGTVIQANSKDYVTMDEASYVKFLDNPVFKSLVSHGHIIVLNEEPAEIKNSLNNLQETNVTLKAQIAELKSQLEAKGNADEAVAAAKAETEALKAEAVKELEEKEAEIAKLKEQLAKAKNKNKE